MNTVKFTLTIKIVNTLLAVSSVLVASQDNDTMTYYIKPSHTSTCPHGPCMTLSEFSSQSEELIQEKVRLEFLAGTHFLYDRIVVNNSVTVNNLTAENNTRKFSMSGDGSTLPQLKSVITCSGTNDVGFSFIDIATVEIKYLSFFSCRNTLSHLIKVYTCSLRMDSISFQNNTIVTAISLLLSNMTASNCSFTDNTNRNIESADGGVALISIRSTVWFNGSNAFVRNTGGGYGGAISVYESWFVMMTSDGQPAYYIEFADSYITSLKANSLIFVSNQVVKSGVGGAIMAITSRIILLGTLYFVENVGDLTNESDHEDEGGNSTGGSIFAFDSITTIKGNGIFRGNKADWGGAVYILLGKVIVIGEFRYVENTARDFGGAFAILSAEFFSREKSIYRGNGADFGGAVLLATSRAIIDGEYIIHNGKAIGGAAIRVLNSTLSTHGNVVILNCDWKKARTGPLYVTDQSELAINGALNITKNNLGITAVESKLVIRHLIMDKNYREAVDIGTGIVAVNSTIIIYGNSTVTNNSGTPIILWSSQLAMHGSVKIIGNSDERFSGGVYMVQSSVILYNVEIHISRNSGRDGGAFYISGGTLAFAASVKLYVQENQAQRGGGIFVQDVISFQTCAPKDADYVILNANPHKCFLEVQEENKKKQMIHFRNNFASEIGTDLYGGMLESCNMSNQNVTMSGLNIFTSMSTFTKSNTSIIASDPFQVCVCKNQSLSCELNTTTFNVRRGQTFSISLAATGQANGIVPTTVRAQFKETDYQHTGLAPNQAAQQSGLQCQTFNYTVFSAEDFVELTVYADGPCRDLGDSSLLVQVKLMECSVGFQLSQGNCICHPQIQHFTNTCLPETGEIERRENWWIGLVYANGTFRGFITHAHCPFDYCKKGTIFFNLSLTDLQCAWNRLGILCGGCQHGLSLTLGGSACRKCESPILGPIVVLAVIAAGIILVITLLVLRLNVAVGTINGLVFYANIMSANKSVFFPNGNSNILTVFIAWLNLDFGIESCFYNGMDMYSKTWLQFLFPLYIWALLLLIIVGSHYSSKMSRLFGRNPVACLATLILLSYTKLLQTLITVLAFTVIEYPDGDHRTVWLYDANIRYLRGKHIPLFIAALCILVFLFLPYTAILTTGQWIQKKMNLRYTIKIKRCITPFFDAYYAPFLPSHCYWPGGLLILRCILLLVFSLNTSGNASNNLIAIIISMVVVFTFLQQTGSLYKSRATELLEISFLLNLLLLSISTSHVIIAGGNQSALVFTSVGVAFVQFIGILLYHAYIQTKEWKFCIQMQMWSNDVLRNIRRKQKLSKEADETVVESHELAQEVISPKISTVLRRESLLEI